MEHIKNLMLSAERTQFNWTSNEEMGKEYETEIDPWPYT